MNRSIVLAAGGGAAVAALVVLGVTATVDNGPRRAGAQVPSPSPSAAAGGTRTVTVDGVGSVSGIPDIVTVSLGVQIEASTATEALATTSTKAQKLVDTLTGAGVGTTDLQTGYVSVYPDYRGGYMASNSVTATIHDVSKAGPVIDAAASAVGDGITLSGVTFSIAQASPLYAKARQLAVGDARQRADQLASAAGASVGAVVTMDESAQYMPAPIASASVTTVAGPASGAPPIEPGRQNLQLSVQVVFSLVA